MNSLANVEGLKEPETRKYLEDHVFPGLLPAIEDLLRVIQLDLAPETIVDSNSAAIAASETLKVDPVIWLAQRLYRKHHGIEWKEVADYLAEIPSKSQLNIAADETDRPPSSRVDDLIVAPLEIASSEEPSPE